MSKRKALQDLYPQWLDMTAEQEVMNQWETTPWPLPVPRLRRERGDEVQVIEILKVNFHGPNLETVVDEGRVSCKLMTKDYDADPKEIPTVIATVSIECTGAGSFVNIEPNIQDMTDGDGHGYLVAVDTLYIGIASANQTATTKCHVRIYWRFKTVPLAEFLGLIQSQV